MSAHTRHEAGDGDDEDSLFGSPPPSPGRAASPALALPSSGYYSGRSTSTAAAQNVGTIALPGSHPDSKLPINPLALSLNHGIVHRPPALPHQMQHQPPSSQSSFPVYGHAPVSAASLLRGGARPAAPIRAPRASAGPSTLPKKPPKKRTRPSSRDEPSPKPAGPEFALPDPAAPPPTHFLRNQENLLGRAGRIARVKPATFTPVRGSTPSNPILVDDEDDRPSLGRRPLFSENAQPYIDPALLTAPTNQEIVSVLIGQKDIFPILEGVLKLVVGNNPAARPKTNFELTMPHDQSPLTPSTPTPGSSYPAKKRKLNRVPAGATDWDVPYPFPQGEGPEEYHRTWERERGKQLISQLIQLIKTAATKAATKKYLAEQPKADEEIAGGGDGSAPKQKGRRSAKDRSDTDTNTVQQAHSRQPSCDVLQDTSNTPSTSITPSSTNSMVSQIPFPSPDPQHPQTHPSPSEMNPSMTAAFDQLMTSFDNFPDQGPSQIQTAIQDTTGLTFTHAQNFFAPQNITTTINSGNGIGAETTPTPTPVDQPLFDTWMSFLESFPMNFDGTPNAFHAQPNTIPSATSTSTPASQCSTTTPGTPLEAFDFANMLGTEMAGVGAGALAGAMGDFDALLASMFQQQQPQPQPQPHTGDGANLHIDVGCSDFAAAPTFGDHLIDPSLLALGLQNQLGASSVVAASSTNPSARIAAPSPPDAISPMATGSSLGGSTSPNTPASAEWELSMPDVFMDGGGVGSGMGDGQGMWRSTMWDFSALAYEDTGPAAWASGVGDGSGDAMLDFGILPEAVEDLQALGGGYVANVKGKGKEREAGPIPASISTSAPTSTPIPASSQPPFLPPSQSLSDNTPRNPSAPPVMQPLLKTISRQRRRDDIIKRAEEQKRAIQQELDVVKTRLWETTIEQAGLVTLQKRLAAKAQGQGKRG